MAIAFGLVVKTIMFLIDNAFLPTIGIRAKVTSSFLVGWLMAITLWLQLSQWFCVVGCDIVPTKV